MVCGPDTPDIMKVAETPCTIVLAQQQDVVMYKFPITPEHTDFLSSVRADDLTLRIILQREDRVPMPQGQMDALRMELEDLQWLDALMALMKAAGNDTRVRILYLLWRHGEVRVTDLAVILQLTPPAISRHLKMLRSYGLAQARRDAQAIYYRLNTDAEFIQSLISFFEEAALLPRTGALPTHHPC